MEPDKAAEGRSGLVWRNGRLLVNVITMQVKLFTIPLFGSEEAVEEMNKFLRGNKVVDITRSQNFQFGRREYQHLQCGETTIGGCCRFV